MPPRRQHCSASAPRTRYCRYLKCAARAPRRRARAPTHSRSMSVAGRPTARRLRHARCSTPAATPRNRERARRGHRLHARCSSPAAASSTARRTEHLISHRCRRQASCKRSAQRAARRCADGENSVAINCAATAAPEPRPSSPSRCRALAGAITMWHTAVARPRRSLTRRSRRCRRCERAPLPPARRHRLRNIPCFPPTSTRVITP